MTLDVILCVHNYWYIAMRMLFIFVSNIVERCKKMEKETRFVELQNMRIAAALGFGPEPESIAWKKILQFINYK